MPYPIEYEIEEIKAPKNYQKGEYKEAFRNIHAIKGVAKNLGLADTIPHLVELSDLYRAEKYSEADGLVTVFCKEYEEILDLINKYKEIAQ